MFVPPFGIIRSYLQNFNYSSCLAQQLRQNLSLLQSGNLVHEIDVFYPWKWRNCARKMTVRIRDKFYCSGRTKHAGQKFKRFYERNVYNFFFVLGQL